MDYKADRPGWYHIIKGGLQIPLPAGIRLPILTAALRRFADHMKIPAASSGDLYDFLFEPDGKDPAAPVFR